MEAAIKAKASQEEIQNILKEAVDEEQTEQFSPLKVSKSHKCFAWKLAVPHYCLCLFKISVFVQTLLNLGNKSFSHSFAAIAKFHSTLKVGEFCHLWSSVMLSMSLSPSCSAVTRMKCDSGRGHELLGFCRQGWLSA